MIRDIDLRLLDFPDQANGRLALDSRRVEVLANQLANQPLLHPITVHPTGDRYTLIAGRHRAAAFHKLGRPTIPALIVEATDMQAATLRLAENVTRSQLSPIEEANQLAALLASNPGGVDAVAEDLGRPALWILDRLEILAWPDALHAHIHARRISLAAARILVRITPPELRDRLIHDAATHGCSARTAQLWLQTSHHDDPVDPAPSEFLALPAVTKYETTTRTECVLCRHLKDIATTHVYRICDPCYVELQQITNQPIQQSPLTTPPIYDPPPRIPQTA